MTTATSSKRFLLTGARSYVTLDLARQLNAKGHEVFVAETSPEHICQYSNAIKKAFVVPSPRFSKREFLNELIHIVNKYEINMLIPTCEEIFYVSQALHRFPKECRVFTPPFDELEPLHNKWSFTQLLKKHGFATPMTFLIRNDEDLDAISFNKPYVLKASYCRASLQVIKMLPDMPLPDIKIESYNPWLAQEWLEGDRYCSFNVCSKGKILAHSTYPVEYANKGNYCLSFSASHQESILDWTTRFVEKINFTGQIAFDFIETQEGILYAIECNPRATSGLHLFTPEENIADAFLENNKKPIFAKDQTKRQLAIGMMLYGWQHPPVSAPSASFLQTLFRTQDVIYDKQDLKPFLYMPLIFFKIWRKSRKLKKNLPATFTHDIEWNNEPNS